MQKEAVGPVSAIALQIEPTDLVDATRRPDTARVCTISVPVSSKVTVPSVVCLWGGVGWTIAIVIATPIAANTAPITVTTCSVQVWTTVTLAAASLHEEPTHNLRSSGRRACTTHNWQRRCPCNASLQLSLLNLLCRHILEQYRGVMIMG